MSPKSSSLKQNCSQKEWQVRVDLAAAYRLIEHFGMAELIYNHISVRVPGENDAFLINPFGLRYDEIKASNLLKINSEAKVLQAKSKKQDLKVNPAGFIIHSAIHEARPEVNCIVHTHTIAGMSIASLPEGLQLYSQEALRFYDRVGYHDFQGIVLDAKEKKALLKSLGNKPVLILRNHGLLTLGTSVAQAFCLMYYLERACQVQLTLQGKQAKKPSKKVCEKTAEQHWNKVYQLDDLVWPAMIRLLDQKDSSYKK
ncbi:MAG: class II aldolase/adducin family protein [Deltaproteobacteria bacterium]|nr:class II aldolase/adducin family protein [Deltaproteobacteria bacterium]